jgi:hypothetical protein
VLCGSRAVLPLLAMHLCIAIRQTQVLRTADLRTADTGASRWRLFTATHTCTHARTAWRCLADPDYDGYTLYENGTPGENAIRNSKQPVVKDIASVEVLISSAAEFNKPAPS